MRVRGARKSSFRIPTDQVSYSHGCCPGLVLGEESPRCPEKGMAQHEERVERVAVGEDKRREWERCVCGQQTSPFYSSARLETVLCVMGRDSRCGERG